MPCRGLDLKMLGVNEEKSSSFTPSMNVRSQYTAGAM